MRKNHRGKKKNKGTRNSSTSVLRDIREELRDNLTTLPRIRDVMPMKVARYRTFINVTTWDVLNFSSSTSSTVNLSFYATLNGIPGYSNLVEVFDQYRILQVVYNFLPATTANQIPETGFVYSALDYEDANTPANAAELEQYDTCMITPFGNRFQRIVNPRISLAAYASGVFASYATVRNTWIDCASPGVQHYGLKVSIPAFGAQAYKYQIKGTIYVQLRSQI